MNGERWLPVPGSEGRYDVSDLGRVRSWLPWRGTPTPRLLSIRPNKAGYATVGLFINGQKQVLVHWIVLRAFVGPRPDGMEGRHLDGNPMNALLTNLRYGTSSENTRDQVLHGTHNNASRTHCKHGHPFDDANTKVTAQGRYCRICLRQNGRTRQRAYRSRQRAAA